MRGFIKNGIIFYLFFLLIIFPPVINSEDQNQAGKDEIWISGHVVWPGNELANTSVEVFTDPQFKNLYTRALLLEKTGEYALSIDIPGTYYLVAFVDYNDNALFDTGDAMGIYGVTDWANPAQKPKPLNLTKGLKLNDIDIPITSVVDSQGRVMALTASNSSSRSGISGKVIWPDHKTSGAIIFAYTDPTWNNRIGQAVAREDGRYELNISSGRYYLIAVIDENKTNLLDAGDKFGIWGMTRFGAFPRPINVEAGQVVKDRNILIIGRMGISGKALPLQSGIDEKTEGVAGKEEISGKVTWSGRSFKSAVIQAYGDPSMTTAAAQAKTDDKGRFKLPLPDGEYYIVATVDADGDGKYTAGDGIGSYGSANATEETPKKLVVNKDTKNAEIGIVITAEFDKSGQLKPIPFAVASSTTPSSPEPQSSASTVIEVPSTMQGISGKIVWEGGEIAKATLIFSKDSEFKDGIRVPLELVENEKYTCSAPAGDYYIMAIVDRDSNGQVNSGDGIGTYGTGYWGEPQKVTVIEGYITPNINININSIFGLNGEITQMQTPAIARFRYGEPDKVTTDNADGKDIQEWWYWEKGLSFTFEKGDMGWNLAKTDEFTPMVESKDALTTGVESPDGVIYYTFDRNIWVINADGKKRRWIAQGTYPSTTADGDKLLLTDTNGNIYLIEPMSEVAGNLIVSRRKSGFQPDISNNGKAVAFTQLINGYRHIVLKNLETNEESILPIDSMELYYPAWSSDDTLIAYSGASSSEADKHNRDIYYYDLTNKRSERISMNPLDEFEPAWSPSNNKFLVYCRAEDEHSQIWIVSFDDNGKPAERQLTKYGGRNPSWSPKGDKIIYENNSQLWTINPDGSAEVPLLVNDEPILGQDPFWTR